MGEKVTCKPLTAASFAAIAAHFSDNSGSNVAAKSNDGESPQSGEEPYIPFKVGETEEAAESAAEAGVPLGQTEEGTRETVFRENNQFSAFVAGMVAAVICVALGMGLVFLYEKGKTKKL